MPSCWVLVSWLDRIADLATELAFRCCRQQGCVWCWLTSHFSTLKYTLYNLDATQRNCWISICHRLLIKSLILDWNIQHKVVSKQQPRVLQQPYALSRNNIVGWIQELEEHVCTSSNRSNCRSDKIIAASAGSGCLQHNIGWIISVW